MCEKHAVDLNVILLAYCLLINDISDKCRNISSENVV